MIHLPDVTLVCVAGIQHDLSYKAFEYSKKNIKYGDCLYFSDIMPDGIETETYVNIKCIDETGFSNFMFYELWKYINTSHCLFVHHDGFVINPNLWSNSFLKYDYIGAPWPSSFGFCNSVGNGGFSLRSKKILQIPKENSLKLQMCNIRPYPIEDLNYCVFHHNTFLSCGVKYPDINTAALFSSEIFIENVTTESFGFHDYKYWPIYKSLL